MIWCKLFLGQRLARIPVVWCCAASVNMAHPRAAHHGMWRLKALDHLAIYNLKISALGG